jgi:hypothetical protein
MKTVLMKLAKVQATLKCDKSRTNSFGNYKYRSCEDILEAVKPLAHGAGCLVLLSDRINNIGDRYYVEATATLYDLESGETICNTASAREEESKKGIDGSQITGAASSYARKYALNGLFCIDDTKDADTDEHARQGGNTPAKAHGDRLINESELAELDNLIAVKAADPSSILKFFKHNLFGEFTLTDYVKAVSMLKRKPDAA